MTPEEIAERLRNTKASWELDGQGVRGTPSQTRPAPPTTPTWVGEHLQKSEQKIFFPQPTNTTTTEAQSTAATAINYSFWLSDATIIVAGEPSNRVKIFDGKVNGEFPDGMGSDNYILDLADPSDSLIFVEVNFNPSSLAITDRSLGSCTSAEFGSPPFDSRIDSDTEGTLFYQIGFTFMDDNDVFRIVQTRAGNIDFAFTYGVLNTKPALLPVDSQPGWLDLDAITGP